MFDALKKKLAERTANVVESIVLDEDQRNLRVKICETCEHKSSFNICRMCGCYIPAKTYLPGASCPLKKWVPIIVEHEKR